MTASDFAEEGTFDPGDFEEELAAAPTNLDIGTTLWFENERMRVWEIRLDPGERGPFHIHTRRYFLSGTATTTRGWRSTM